MRHCFLCGRNGWEDPLDRHHIFSGHANRKLSEKYGLVVYLCHFQCHLGGVHSDARLDEKIRRYGQRKAMREQGWTTDEFIKIFGRNYL